jgi:hypothetical protein
MISSNVKKNPTFWLIEGKYRTRILYVLFPFIGYIGGYEGHEGFIKEKRRIFQSLHDYYHPLLKRKR